MFTGRKQYIYDRVLKEAYYISETGATVRDAAKKFGVSKSTVHKDMVERLDGVNHILYKDVQKILKRNKEERYIRGGMATKRKYERMKER